MFKAGLICAFFFDVYFVIDHYTLGFSNVAISLNVCC